MDGPRTATARIGSVRSPGMVGGCDRDRPPAAVPRAPAGARCDERRRVRVRQAARRLQRRAPPLIRAPNARRTASRCPPVRGESSTRAPATDPARSPAARDAPPDLGTGARRADGWRSTSRPHKAGNAKTAGGEARNACAHPRRTRTTQPLVDPVHRAARRARRAALAPAPATAALCAYDGDTPAASAHSRSEAPSPTAALIASSRKRRSRANRPSATATRSAYTRRVSNATAEPVLTRVSIRLTRKHQQETQLGSTAGVSRGGKGGLGVA